MKAPEQTFRFTSELGRRLKEFRVKAGLNQAQLVLPIGTPIGRLASRLISGPVATLIGRLIGRLIRANR
jgi:hypothetical protein